MSGRPATRKRRASSWPSDPADAWPAEPWPVESGDAEWLARLRADAEAFARDLDPATGPLADTLRADLRALLASLAGDGA